MRTFAGGFTSGLVAAQDSGIRPAYFFHVVAKDRTTKAAVPYSFWSGDEDITLTVELPDGTTVSRAYTGGVNLSVRDIEYVADLTDNAVTVALSHLAPTVVDMVRGKTVRYSYCEIHATSWVGGTLASVPQLVWVGVVDAAPLSIGAIDNDGGVVFSVRSELMTQLMISNPAKSSDSHQKRRLATDEFSLYAGVIGTRPIQWYKGK